MADDKKTTTKQSVKTEGPTGQGGAPLLHLPTKPADGVARASSEERAIPVTHPDSPVVGADAYNHPVTVEPAPPENEVH